MAPYLTLMREDAPQWLHEPREVFNGARWIMRAGARTICCHGTRSTNRYDGESPLVSLMR